MRAVAWMLAFVIVAGAGYALWRARTQWQQRRRAAEERMASFVAQMKPATDAGERLLFEAAAKTAQAGEPVLAIQLYARLLARYPQSALAVQARAAVAEQKAKLAKA